MKPINLLRLSLCMLYVTGCGEGLTGPGESQLWPMSVGDQWIGQKEYYDAHGNALGKLRDTIRITGSVEIGGETWYEFSDGGVRTNRADGVWARIPGSADDEYAHLFAKYPTARGDTFSTAVYVQTFQNGQQGRTFTSWIETISSDSVVTVPQGRLRAHVYRSVLDFVPRGLEDIDDRWALTLGVGPVVMECSSGSPQAGPFRGAASCVWRLEEARVR